MTGWVDWLMSHYGMPTLFMLSVVPNPLFEVAGWTAGATRYSFWKFMGAVTPGKVCRGLLLAYVGEEDPHLWLPSQRHRLRYGVRRP